MNLNENDGAQLGLGSDLAGKQIDQYVMTAPEADGVLSKYVRFEFPFDSSNDSPVNHFLYRCKCIIRS